MKTIDVRTGRPYQVLIGKGALEGRRQARASPRQGKPHGHRGRQQRDADIRRRRRLELFRSRIRDVRLDLQGGRSLQESLGAPCASQSSRLPAPHPLRLDRRPGRRRDGRPGRACRFPLPARHRLCPDPDVAPRDGRFERRRQNRRQSRVRQKPHGRLSSARARGLRPGLPRDAARSRNVLRLGRSHQVRGPQGRRAFSRCSKAPSPKTS